jgi:hypothetical protein
MNMKLGLRVAVRSFGVELRRVHQLAIVGATYLQKELRPGEPVVFRSMACTSVVAASPSTLHYLGFHHRGRLSLHLRHYRHSRSLLQAFTVWQNLFCS